MNKKTIWIIVAIMTVSFGGILILQINYIQEMIRMRREQFNESVQRALYAVSTDVEQYETRRWLEHEIKEARQHDIAQAKAVTTPDSLGGEYVSRVEHYYQASPDGQSFSTMTIRSRVSVGSLKRPKVSISEHHGRNSLPNTSQSLQDEINKRYLHQRYLIDDVVWKMLRHASLKPVAERIDFKTLDDYLRAELLNNGVDLIYHFSIRNKNGKEVYRCSDFDPRGVEQAYTQVLFLNDPPTRQSVIKVHFPALDSYIKSSVSFVVPSVVFMLLLVFTYVFVVYSIFRQKRLSEMRNDFVNNMTHEFKTPISTISLAAQMLKDADVDKSPQIFKQVSNVIFDETKRLRFQVDKVLQMSMFDKSRVALKFKEIDAHAMIENVVNTFSLKVQNYNGVLNTDLAADDPIIFADDMHITNVVFNLLDNAVKYRRDDVDLKLEVSTWNEGDRLLISIADNGIGIKKENVKKVFDRFYRVHTGNRHDVKGFGLGLAYVKRIITDHRGTVRVESELNVGTKFIISLPLLKE
ncbi:MAG TPA: HAMP domain-containing sensor histidine kinase [Bacteroidaceae bacterium]|nr:HAMP domain-containing sensor histidine kinase [Bacteroidaceae bacterium]